MSKPEHDTGLPDEIEFHLSQIEHHTRMIRDGENHAVSPWDFRFPTATELRGMREACGLSREELADMMDYAEPTVAKVETGAAAPGREYLRRCLIVYRREWPNGERE